MKKSPWILAAVLLFASAAAFAQTPQSHPPLSQEALAAILGQPAASSCAVQPSGARQAAKRPAAPTGKSACTATALCGSSPSQSCSGNSSCSAIDQDCTNFETGSVTCDGVPTPCPNACSCSSLPFSQRQCCFCAQNGDCTSCCRCDGGTIGQCALQCS
jgi:hypothetical protein